MPKITKDGVTVAKSITLKDKLENLGARLVQDVAQKTSEVGEDGTTTATVLARDIYSDGVKNVTAGCNPMDLRMRWESENVVDEVTSTHTNTISTTVGSVQAVTTSANGDTHVENPISQVMVKVGEECIITAQFEDEIEITEAMHTDLTMVEPDGPKPQERTSGCCIADTPEKGDAGPNGMGGMGGF